MEWNAFHTLCLVRGRRWQNQCRRRCGSKLRGWAFFVTCLLFFCWSPNFDGLSQSFLLPLVKSTYSTYSMINGHFFFFFFRLSNDRRHDQPNSLALLTPLQSECLAWLGCSLLSLRVDNSILLCRLGDKAWSCPRSWYMGLAQSPFLTLLLLSVKMGLSCLGVNKQATSWKGRSFNMNCLPGMDKSQWCYLWEEMNHERLRLSKNNLQILLYKQHVVISFNLVNFK